MRASPGQHLTLLNVPSAEELSSALREIWWSANSDSAITYRKRVGLFTRPSVAVVVQRLLDPETAGVMFTQNPMTGADERMIEASWGLGEAVVAGLVIPDSYRVARAGQVLDRRPGLKRIAIRGLPTGGTFEEEVPADLQERLCLDDAQLAELNRLADRCETVYGPARDVEWAIADGTLYLLQCRAVTRAAREPRMRRAAMAGRARRADRADGGAPVEVLRGSRSSRLTESELQQVALSSRSATSPSGETVIKEGSDGAAFFLIDDGEAVVTIRGAERANLTAGDHFGEIALIDEDVRSATITAATDLVCYGLTLWEFRPLVVGNGAIGWKLMQSLTKKLRLAQLG